MYFTKAAKKPGKYGLVKRSVLRNLHLSMLAFGLMVGLLFPVLTRIILKTDHAFSPVFIAMCVAAGLLVGVMNFLIFKNVVSRELKLIQKGMNHVNVGIAGSEVLTQDCRSECILEITSADIIGDISQSFNSLADEIFKRLELEGEIRQLSSKLMSSVKLEDVADTILERFSAVMEAKAGLLYGGKAQDMQLLSHFGVDNTEGLAKVLAEQFGPIEKALKTREVLFYSQMDGWEWFSQSTPLGGFRPGSIILIPLIAKQKPVGIVVLACGTQAPSPQQKKVLAMLCSFAAPNLDNSILHKLLTELAAVDELTNILNRRFGMRRLKEEFSLCTRHGMPITTIMVDIDHFKNFNDTFGHNAGDAVLRMVASTLRNDLRTEDMVCRYGGEEFLIVLTDSGIHDSALAAERLRRAVEANQIRWGEKDLSVSISSGVATYPAVRASVCEELITAADKALYTAKELGRNQVAVHDGEKVVRFVELKMEKPEKKK